jgi:hypothetical protein
MRRFLFWVMVISGLLTIIVGIAEARPSHAGLPVAHIFFSVIFILTIIIHLIINQKAVVKCIRGK